MSRLRRTLFLLVPALVLAALIAAPASASRYVSIDGGKAAGPSAYDEVFVDKHGPKRAKTVLVMIPGTGGGSGSVDPIARDLSLRIKGLQVWGFDRRSQAFEDTSAFEAGDAEAAADYYLGFNYDRVVGSDVPFVSNWGFATEMKDLHEVIERASRGGTRKVILGGHSRGASSVVAYAAWHFAGDGAGYNDLDGLVLIDGGLAAFGPQDFSLADAKAGLDEIRGGALFNDPLGAGIPEIGPIFSELGALYAKVDPEGTSILQDHPLVQGAGLSPPFDVTNEGFAGYIFDPTYSSLGGALHFRAGRLADGAEPRGWVDGENVPIQDFAKAFSGEPGNATEWYYPRRMVLDTAAANALKRTPAAKFLNLRLFHAKRIDTPLYAFQTALTNGGVLAGAETVIENSRIKRTKLVDASRGTSHLDPVLAPKRSNRFTQTVIPFLRRIAR